MGDNQEITRVITCYGTKLVEDNSLESAVWDSSIGQDLGASQHLDKLRIFVKSSPRRYIELSHTKEGNKAFKQVSLNDYLEVLYNIYIRAV